MNNWCGVMESKCGSDFEVFTVRVQTGFSEIALCRILFDVVSLCAGNGCHYASCKMYATINF